MEQNNDNKKIYSNINSYKSIRINNNSNNIKGRKYLILSTWNLAIAYHFDDEGAVFEGLI